MEKNSKPTNNLAQLRQSAISAIQSALNSEPKLNNSDLLTDCQNWENIIKQTILESEINEFKQKVLTDIENKRKNKQESTARDKKINQAHTTEEKINLLGEMGSSLGEHTSEQQTKLEQIKDSLAVNPAQLREAIQKEITTQMTAFKIKETDLSSAVKTQLEQLKNETNSTKIREIEKAVTQEVGGKYAEQTITSLEQRIDAVIKSKEKVKIQELKTELLKIIGSSNAFLQAKKSQVQALLQKLEQNQTPTNTSPNSPKFPLKVVIPVLIVVVVGIIGLAIYKKRNLTPQQH